MAISRNGFDLSAAFDGDLSHVQSSFERGKEWAAKGLQTDEVVTVALAGQMFEVWSSKVRAHCGKRQHETDLRQEVM